MSRFKKGERVNIRWSPENGGHRTGTVARVDYWVSGYVYWVDVDGIGCKIVNSVMMEAI